MKRKRKVSGHRRAGKKKNKSRRLLARLRKHRANMTKRVVRILTQSNLDADMQIRRLASQRKPMNILVVYNTRGGRRVASEAFSTMLEKRGHSVLVTSDHQRAGILGFCQFIDTIFLVGRVDENFKKALTLKIETIPAKQNTPDVRTMRLGSSHHPSAEHSVLLHTFQVQLDKWKDL